MDRLRDLRRMKLKKKLRKRSDSHLPLACLFLSLQSGGSPPLSFSSHSFEKGGSPPFPLPHLGQQLCTVKANAAPTTARRRRPYGASIFVVLSTSTKTTNRFLPFETIVFTSLSTDSPSSTLQCSILLPFFHRSLTATVGLGHALY